ncbi:MAG: ThiF family adenylyltransferase [Bacteroidales bacterium]|jgi:hypothetical protein|nr:ThiF family adenylyltransferase [Bacteroidales bacterium]
MLAQLISHNDDIKRLWDEGLVMEERNSFLIIHRVPYLNSKKEIKYGSLVSNLQLSGFITNKNPSHTVYFAGEIPCKLNGKPFSIVNNSKACEIANGFKVDHYFSSLPKPHGYKDYYHKMMTYINMISAPAKALDSSVTEKGKQILQTDAESVFNYMDTNSSKPELSLFSELYKNQKIGIIGLGGTGSYILDLVSKVPVKEIHIYDMDWYYNNNAFRSPGAASIKDLLIPKKKVDYYKEIYSKMHKGIFAHPENITSTNINELLNYHFIFLSIDKGDIKKEIIQLLEENKIPFIDVGMGIYNNKGALTGLIRVTTGTPEKTDHIWNKGCISFKEGLDNEYDSNIQIAELNSLNAALAVIKWKKLLGYYHDLTKEHNMFYRINSNKMLNEETET